MKVKRIVSILLTGSMLLSLLPVSALAAAPVFDAPAQTTAKKAAPLVQEADASRSTEEEAATRSSRDLDAENGTSDSFTIDLNAGGMPESEGDYDHWFYSANSTTLFLYDGTFTLQPSSESGAESALQTELDIREGVEFNGGTVGRRAHNEGTISDGTFQWAVYNYGTISNGTFQWEVENNKTISDGTFKGEVFNYGTISDGTFQGEVHNHGTISDGTFQGSVYNSKDISGGAFQKPVNNYGGTISGGIFKKAVEVYASAGHNATIEGGTFEKGMKLANDDASITISDGLFDGEVFIERCRSPLSITGGLFTQAVNASSIDDPTNLQIIGGYFVNEPTMPEGSNTGFATVSDQSGRTFQVPVNDGFSENSYKTLYVPHGMSERQANPITVKTDTALIDCLADDVSIMGTDKVQLNDDGSYTIEVYQPTSIVLVTEKPAPSTPDEPGDELDPGFSSGAAALGIVLGTAGLGYITYAHISSLYLYYTLPGGFIPSTRQELANVLWTTAGKPDPVSTALYTDIPADNIEQQKAARWCVEQGLLSDYGATFGPDTKVTNARIIRAWNSLKKVPVTITK